MIGVLLVVLCSYLLGSLPTSIIVGRVFFGKDPREHGSGNAGGTNAFRVFGWKGGLPTVLVDVAKGLAATLFVSRIPVPPAFPHELIQIVAGCAAIVGHVWTVFAGFRGGKGVAAAAGMLIGLYPIALVVCLGVFGITLVSFGIVSVASLCAALLFPVVVLLLDAAGVAHVSPLLFWFSIPVALLIFYTHRANIGRLVRGQENRFPKLMLFARIFHKTKA